MEDRAGLSRRVLRLGLRLLALLGPKSLQAI